MYEFIVNPGSRSGKGLKIWKEIEKKLQAQHLEYQVFLTACPGHAAKLASSVTEDGRPHHLIILGGDGTVHEVLSGIRHLDKVTLGYIPTGSSNDFARGLGIPSRIDEALLTALYSRRIRLLDVGAILCQNHIQRFGVSSGIGYDASICYQVSISRVKKLLNRLGLGKFAYVILSLKCLVLCRPCPIRLLLDNRTVHQFKRAFFATAMNLPFEGGGCRFCPDARPDDGRLDLIVVEGISKWYALTLLPLVFSGRHVDRQGVHIFRCHEATVLTWDPLIVHVDGEPLPPCRKIRFYMEPHRIRITLPEKN